MEFLYKEKRRKRVLGGEVSGSKGSEARPSTDVRRSTERESNVSGRGCAGEA